jgi:hypothetical protein
VDISNEDGGVGEANEDFAADAVVVAKDLRLPDDIVNVDDGEIAACAGNLIRRLRFNSAPTDRCVARRIWDFRSPIAAQRAVRERRRPTLLPQEVPTARLSKGRSRIA